jgi:hypothetical protein
MIHTLATYKQKKHMRIPGAQNDLATFMAQRMVLVEEIKSVSPYPPGFVLSHS